MDRRTLAGLVDEAFARRAVGLERWDDPHPDRMPDDDEYSRCEQPAKWRIVVARTDAWIDALEQLGAVRVERDVVVEWGERPGPIAVRIDLVVPMVVGGVALVVVRTRMGDVDEAGVVLGVRGAGDQEAWPVASVPDCGCDACDSGSQDAIDEIDHWIVPIVTGEFRLLRRGRAQIIVCGDQGRQARNVAGRRGTVDRVIADPRGWHEVIGPAWLHGVRLDQPQ